MELNSKKLERTSRFVYYSISAILCIFLILLSNRIIGDLNNLTTQPDTESFENKTTLATLEKEIEDQNAELEQLDAKKETVEKAITMAKDNYANEKQSFDNWLQTRKTLGSPDKDREVLVRAKQLDDSYAIEKEWREQLGTLQSQIDKTTKKKHATQQLVDDEQSAAYEKYGQAIKLYELKVFLIRLAFVAPVLALGIFFFIRYRRRKFYPLYFGFTLYSLYAFFFGLVPYLPSYGGYVRYSVGVILSVGLGYYAIKRIRQFIELKQAELKISTEERAKKIQSTTAEKALELHFCPSCGKDFLLRKWEYPPAISPNAVECYQFVTTYCRHCGMTLFKKCAHCGTKNFAHLPFCSSCGTTVVTEG